MSKRVLCQSVVKRFVCTSGCVYAILQVDRCPCEQQGNLPFGSALGTSKSSHDQLACFHQTMPVHELQYGGGVLRKCTTDSADERQ